MCLSAYSYCTPGKKNLPWTWALYLIPYFKNFIKLKLLPTNDLSILKINMWLIAKGDFLDKILQ